MLLGEIFNWVAHLGASSEAYTNDLTAAAEGTKFLMRADPRGTTVIVLEGRVRCTPTSGGAWHAITVTPNQQISGTVRAYAGPTPVDARRAALWVARRHATCAGRPSCRKRLNPGSIESAVGEPAHVSHGRSRRERAGAARRAARRLHAATQGAPPRRPAAGRRAAAGEAPRPPGGARRAGLRRGAQPDHRSSLGGRRERALRRSGRRARPAPTRRHRRGSSTPAALAAKRATSTIPS